MEPEWNLILLFLSLPPSLPPTPCILPAVALVPALARGG